tara:strand:+ start:2350 stop:2751 length:402 start_codon:yes stop_codon:yes gene_type:complete
MLKAIKRFFAKRKLEKKSPAYLKYYLDDEGNIFVDFKWDNKIDKNADGLFASLLFESSSGKLIEDVLEFIESECEKAGKTKDFEAFGAKLALYRMGAFVELSEKLQEKTQFLDDEVVVKPTDVATTILKENNP